MVARKGQDILCKRSHDQWNSFQTGGSKSNFLPLHQTGTDIDFVQNFASGGVIVTGLYGNDSKLTFGGIEGTGKPQWVSFYYQSENLVDQLSNFPKLTAFEN